MTYPEKHRPTWAEIDLDCLAYNFSAIKNFVGDEVKFMAVVKADAYGHGSVVTSKKLEQLGIDWFGVALPEEGVELRKSGIRKRILCLGGFWQGQEMTLLNQSLTPVIFRLDQAELFDHAAKERGTIAEIHVKIDTGMNRIGVRFEEIEDFAKQLRHYENLHLEGLMTHFASADDLAESEFTNQQIDRFYESVKVFESLGYHPTYKDLANSPASVAFPNSYGNMIRLGGILYGLGDDMLPKEIETPELKSVLSLYSEIAHLKSVPKGETLGYGRTCTLDRDSLIATIPIGYQDGFGRGLSNKADVLVNGSFAPVSGRVSMDWTILDVTDVADVKVGDKVTLIGGSGNRKITAADLAGHLNTISYEITCGISNRVERRVQDRT